MLWFRDESGKDCVYEPFAIEMVNTNRYIEVNDSLSGCPVSSPVSKHERKGVSTSINQDFKAGIISPRKFTM